MVSPTCNPEAALAAFASNFATWAVPIKLLPHTISTVNKKPSTKFISAPATTTNSRAGTLFLLKALGSSESSPSPSIWQ